MVDVPMQGRGEPREIDGAWISDPLPVRFIGITTEGEPLPEIRAVLSFIDGKWEPIEAGLTIWNGGRWEPTEAGRAVIWKGHTRMPIATERWAELGRILPNLILTAITGYGLPNLIRSGITGYGPEPKARGAAEFVAATKRRQRRRWITPDLLAETAAVYAAAGSKPLKAVAAHFQVSEAQASRYIRAAKDDGLIPDKTKD